MRLDTSVRTFTEAVDCCWLCVQFRARIQSEERYGSLDRLN